MHSTYTQSVTDGNRQELIESGHGIMDVVLETCYLEPQENFERNELLRLSELQRMAEEDNARQVELGNEMKSMQIQIQGVIKSKLRVWKKKQENHKSKYIAEMERKQAKKSHQAKQNNKKQLYYSIKRNRPPSDSTVFEACSIVKIALVICPITVYTVIGLTTYCILTIEPLQDLSFLRWCPQLSFEFSISKTFIISTSYNFL